jgi:D-alanyl-D-alanine carboxypeptidase/D-alanyl-D-alanine-endopeptidase (penicillin-binding protein 4)
LKISYLLGCCFALLLGNGPVCAGSTLQQLLNMPQASLLLDSKDPVSRISYQSHVPRIPASTLKILTTWLAIQQWGLDHRFHTDFFLDEKNNLWIKGYGDPMLVSEEIQAIAEALAASGVKHITDIYTDESYFPPLVSVDGQSNSDNPYDAPLAPLAANFNTIYVRVNKQGTRSAESQTPLTETARQLAAHMKPGRHRVNIGNSQLSGRYFAELLRAKLRKQGIQVGSSIRSATVPGELRLHYRHRNRNTLETVLKSMLRYSTNFTANQLFLMLGAERYGPPASMEKSRRAAMEKITSVFNWPGFEIHEGAGLSRNNRISSSQMIELLHKFQPWKNLLYSDVQGILAKSGTLSGISSYAGYLDQAGSSHPFALFIEQQVPFDFRIQVAEGLLSRFSINQGR